MRPKVSPEVARIAREILLPWRAGWAIANNVGWLGESPVGSSAHLDPEALESWRSAIAGANVYLEYGSGGSTVEAVQSVAHVVSVDTDKRFLCAVERKVAATSSRSASFHPIHVDIGWTEQWGRPLFSWRSKSRLARWRNYTSAPWELLEKLALVPDFIFVDGRFRAASVLESFLRLPPDADCQFMLDDFKQRSRLYAVLLPFATDAEPRGRALVFRRRRDFDVAECARLLRIYQTDPE